MTGLQTPASVPQLAEGIRSSAIKSVAEQFLRILGYEHSDQYWVTDPLNFGWEIPGLLDSIPVFCDDSSQSGAKARQHAEVLRRRLNRRSTLLAHSAKHESFSVSDMS